MPPCSRCSFPRPYTYCNMCTEMSPCRPFPLSPFSSHIAICVRTRHPLAHVPYPHSRHILQYVYGRVVLSGMIPITIPVTYCNMCQERDRSMNRRERETVPKRSFASLTPFCQKIEIHARDIVYCLHFNGRYVRKCGMITTVKVQGGSSDWSAKLRPRGADLIGGVGVME